MSGEAWVWTVLAILAVGAVVAVFIRSRRGSGEAVADEPPPAAMPVAPLDDDPTEPGDAEPEPEVVAADGTAAETTEHEEVDGAEPAEPEAVAVTEPQEADEADGVPPPPVPALAALDSAVVAVEVGAAAAAAIETPAGPSVVPAADGSSPSAAHQVKANLATKRYFTPDSPYYVRTRADVYFRAAADAEQAGFRP